MKPKFKKGQAVITSRYNQETVIDRITFTFGGWWYETPLGVMSEKELTPIRKGVKNG